MESNSICYDYNNKKIIANDGNEIEKNNNNKNNE